MPILREKGLWNEKNDLTVRVPKREETEETQTRENEIKGNEFNSFVMVLKVEDVLGVNN